MFDNGPSDRMQFAGMGELTHPGACMVCGNGMCEQGYVRLGVYYEYEGEMYLCYTCLGQAAEIIKCLLPEEAQQLRELSENYATELAEKTQELENANERLAAFDSLLAGAFDTLNDSGGIPTPAVLPSSDEPTSTPAESVKESADSGAESVKSTPVRRRGNPAQSTAGNGSDSITV